MPDRLLLLFAAAMAAWDGYKLVRRRDSVALVSLLFWSTLAWRMVAPLPGHIPALAGLLVLKFTLAHRLDWRMKADLALGRLFLPPLKESALF